MGSIHEQQIGFICLGLPYFDVETAQSNLNETVSMIERRFGVLGPRKVITDRTSLEVAVGALRREEIVCLVLEIGTFPDGDMLAYVAQETHTPIIIHGLPEPRPGELIATNSMCGLNMATYTMTALEHPHTWVFGSATNPEAALRLTQHLESAAALAALRRDRVGLIGYRAPGFYPSAFDELLLRRRLGVSIEHIGLNEYSAQLRSGARRPGPRTTYPAIEGGSLDDDVVARMETAYAALMGVFEQSGLQHFAIKDWPELFDAETPGGLWPSLGWVQGAGYTVAPEGDVNGAITMAIVESLTKRPSFFADISVVDESGELLTLWHYGAPESLASASSDVLYGKEGREVQFTLEPGVATLVRVGQFHRELRILTVAVEVTPNPTRLRRAAAVVRPTRSSAAEVVDHLFDNGWDHHVCLGYGDLEESFRAVGRFTGIPVESI